MSNRKRALELASDEISRIESGAVAPDTQEVMAYALILVLADIGEQLEGIYDDLDLIVAHGIGVENEAAQHHP